MTQEPTTYTANILTRNAEYSAALVLDEQHRIHATYVDGHGKTRTDIIHKTDCVSIRKLN